ncbi:hypothetical protein BDV95DRAFT_559996 [Massariosphaeria phaeospora]|uniref:Uncharacterized protein n=1 Tax=Massariosphaeria phaeospora TaxID=100035 RepID=A0A7C8ICB5_9PLEO|nr:hypothetical protein BDV95DRAFT_559996 [Massariosphaeria phaeospora]
MERGTDNRTVRQSLDERASKHTYNTVFLRLHISNNGKTGHREHARLALPSGFRHQAPDFFSFDDDIRLRNAATLVFALLPARTSTTALNLHPTHTDIRTLHTHTHTHLRAYIPNNPPTYAPTTPSIQFDPIQTAAFLRRFFLLSSAQIFLDPLSAATLVYEVFSMHSSGGVNSL